MNKFCSVFTTRNEMITPINPPQNLGRNDSRRNEIRRNEDDICSALFYMQNKLWSLEGSINLSARAQLGVHITITCQEYVYRGRFTNYTRGKSTRTTKMFQIELRQLIGFIIYIHHSNLKRLKVDIISLEFIVLPIFSLSKTICVTN